MKILAKDFKKIITFLNKILTDIEKEIGSISLIKFNENYFYIVYESESGVLFSKRINLIEPYNENYCIKFRISSLVSYTKFNKEVQILDILTDVIVNKDMKEEQYLFIYNENKESIAVCKLYDGIEYDKKLIELSEKSYTVNTNIFSNIVSNINSINKTSYFKDTDVSFNGIINFVLGTNIKLYINNGIVLGFREINPTYIGSDKVITGQINTSEFSLLNKWMNTVTTKDINIIIYNDYIIIKNEELTISIPVLFTNANDGVIHLYTKMIETLINEEFIFEVDYDDFVSKYNPKQLKADLIVNVTEDLSPFALTMDTEIGKHSFSATQFKNIISPIDEDCNISLCKKFQNPLIIKFDGTGCNVLNKIKS